MDKYIRNTLAGLLGLGLASLTSAVTAASPQAEAKLRFALKQCERGLSRKQPRSRVSLRVIQRDLEKYDKYKAAAVQLDDSILYRDTPYPGTYLSGHSYAEAVGICDEKLSEKLFNAEAWIEQRERRMLAMLAAKAEAEKASEIAAADASVIAEEDSARGEEEPADTAEVIGDAENTAAMTEEESEEKVAEATAEDAIEADEGVVDEPIEDESGEDESAEDVELGADDDALSEDGDGDDSAADVSEASEAEPEDELTAEEEANAADESAERLAEETAAAKKEDSETAADAEEEADAVEDDNTRLSAASAETAKVQPMTSVRRALLQALSELEPDAAAKENEQATEAEAGTEVTENIPAEDKPVSEQVQNVITEPEVESIAEAEEEPQDAANEEEASAEDTIADVIAEDANEDAGTAEETEASEDFAADEENSQDAANEEDAPVEDEIAEDNVNEGAPADDETDAGEDFAASDDDYLQELLAASQGDRKQILTQEKRAPDFMDNEEQPMQAKVWMYEKEDGSECRVYRFKGDKQASLKTNRGECPMLD